MTELIYFIEWVCVLKTNLASGVRYSFNRNTGEVSIVTPVNRLEYTIMSFVYQDGMQELFNQFKKEN